MLNDRLWHQQRIWAEARVEGLRRNEWHIHAAAGQNAPLLGTTAITYVPAMRSAAQRITAAPGTRPLPPKCRARGCPRRRPAHPQGFIIILLWDRLSTELVRLHEARPRKTGLPSPLVTGKAAGPAPRS